MKNEHFFSKCQFSEGNSIHFGMRTATKKNRKKNIYFKNCTCYLGEGNICVDDAKKVNMKTKMKS